MNRPILIVAIGYIIGIIWGLYLKISIVFLYIFLFIIYILINIKFEKSKFKLFSIKRYVRYGKLVLKLNIVIVIIISSFISNNITKYKNNKYETLYENVKEIEVNGVIISNLIEKEYKNRYKMKIYEGKFKNTCVYIETNKNIKLEYGDKIKLKGNYIEPQTMRNYKGFNYKEYLKTLKIYGTIKAEKIEIEEKNSINKILTFINRLKLKIQDNIQNCYDDKFEGIILGIMIGDNSQIDEQTREDFSKSNISHVLAISGMHISYIIYLISKTEVVVGKKKGKIIAIIILALYMFITGFSISVVRACIMGIMYCMAFVVYRKSDTINNITISALILLIDNPFNILSLSFQLTYCGTLGIIIFKPTVEKIIKNIKIKNKKWKYTFLKIQQKSEMIIEIISVSISAQIMILPILVYRFNNIGITFLITNLLLSMVIGFIIIGGICQILISIISIKCGIVLARIIQIPTFILLLISKINFGNFQVATPDLYQIFLYYIIIFWLKNSYLIFNKKHITATEQRIKNIIYLINYKIKSYKKILKILIIIFILTIFCINKIPKNLKVYFIDVGQGDSTLIITPEGKNILIDGGGSNSYDVGKNVLVPYLLSRKINKLDYVMISHFDQDHVRWNFIFVKTNESQKCNYRKAI